MFVNHLLIVNKLNDFLRYSFNVFDHNMANSICYSFCILLTVIGFDDGYFESVYKFLMAPTVSYVCICLSVVYYLIECLFQVFHCVFFFFLC